MIDFEKLLQASKAVDISKAFEDNEKRGYSDDPRYYKLRKKDDVGRATIRWLPDMQGRVPFVKKLDRFVEIDRTAKKFFAAIDRRTIDDNEKDPAQELYMAAWKRFNETQDETWKNLAKKFRARDRYISLIYVVADPNDVPENTCSGLNYLFEYGPEIYGKLSAARKAVDDFGMPLKPVNPFALNSDGANFGILLKKEDPKNPNEYPNYKSSRFFDHAALFDGDQGAIKNWMGMNQERFYDIYDEVAPNKVESYDEIVKKLINALSEDVYYSLMGGRKVVESDKKMDDFSPAPVINTPLVTAESLTGSIEKEMLSEKRVDSASTSAPAQASSSEEDELLSLFK